MAPQTLLKRHFSKEHKVYRYECYLRDRFSLLRHRAKGRRRREVVAVVDVEKRFLSSMSLLVATK